jgi:hypothetical protein
MRHSSLLAHIAALAALVVAPIALVAQGRSVVGTYNTTLTGPQGAVKAVIVITGGQGAYSGTLAAEGFPEMTVTKVTPSDTSVLLVMGTPDVGVTVLMKFLEAARVQGILTYQGVQMGIDGTFAATRLGAAGGASLNPVGEYTLVTSEPLMGEAHFNVRCTVTAGTGGVLGGGCGNADYPETPITVSTEGNIVTISGETPAGSVKLVMTVTNGVAEGTISIGNETAKIKGLFAAK